jgi:hypothetical protein
VSAHDCLLAALLIVVAGGERRLTESSDGEILSFGVCGERHDLVGFSGVMAERRLCSRRLGRSPLEDDLRRLGVPRSSEVISRKTLERLRVEAVVGAGSGVCSSVGSGR